MLNRMPSMLRVRPYLAFLLALLGMLVVPVVARAETLMLTQGTEQPARSVGQSNVTGANAQLSSHAYHPLDGISFDDCEKDLVMTFSMNIDTPNPGGQQNRVQIWAGSADCTQITNRQSTTATCWPVYDGSIPESTAFSVPIHARQITEQMASSPPNTGFIQAGEDACHKQTSSGGVQLTLYFMIMDTGGVQVATNATGASFAVLVDMLGPLPLARASNPFGIGDGEIILNWQQVNDPSYAGVRVFCSPNPNSSGAQPAFTATVDLNNCPGNAPVSTGDASTSDGYTGVAWIPPATLQIGAAAVPFAEGGAEGGGCTSNANCSGATPICDITTQTCRGCQTSDCTGAFPVCATTGPNTGACVQCASSSDCPSKTPTCNTSTNLCESQPCSTTNPCTTLGTPICDTSSQTCRACVSMDCTGATPYCNPSTGSCSAVATDASTGSDSASSSGTCPGDPACGGGLLSGISASAVPSAYQCGGDIVDKGISSTTVRGLTNGTTYTFAVAPIDAMGNVGHLLQLGCNYPSQIQNFWDSYRSAGGQAGGGFCNASTEDAQLPIGTSIFALAVVASGVGYVRRRRREGTGR
jgi:hypothetical protein